MSPAIDCWDQNPKKKAWPSLEVVFIVILQSKSSAVLLWFLAKQIYQLFTRYTPLVLHKKGKNIQLVRHFKIYSRTSVVASSLHTIRASILQHKHQCTLRIAKKALHLLRFSWFWSPEETVGCHGSFSYNCTIFNSGLIQYNRDSWSNVETFFWSVCFLNTLTSQKS